MYRTNQFVKNIEKALSSFDNKPNIDRSIDHWHTQFNKSTNQFSYFELAKERAAFYRWKSIENSEKLLIEFESNFQKQGGRIIWAPDAKDALNEIEYILNKYLGRLFHNKLGTPFRSHPSMIVEAYTDHLQSNITEPAVGITSANFIVADTGSIAYSENEGNINFITSHTDVLIVLVGIDKIIANLNDLDILWPILSNHTTGEKNYAFNTLISGPAGTGEEGPKDIYIILLDNGRSNLMAHANERESLNCIDCGACHRVCPIFTKIGGYSYETEKTGPIGLITNPLTLKDKEIKDQSFASSLCGKCNEVCPVNIDLKYHIASVRNIKNEAEASIQDKYGWMSWKKMMLKRKRMNQNSSLKSFMLKTMFKRGWGEHRDFPEFAERSFNQLWTDIRGNEQDDDKII
ncbi:MAG: lactate utilization protein [Bacteroidetes bacterium]|nr:lactate utilization protein [Bacteroidota bacterium]